MAPANLKSAEFIAKLKSYRSDVSLKGYASAFPVDKRAGDQFIGVRMGDVFKLAKEFIDMPLSEVEKLLESPVHEVRVGGVSIMDFQARSKKTTAQRRKELFELYIRRHDRINTWDLVDRSGFYVVGSYLIDKPRDILYKLAHSKQMAERRTAIISAGQIAMKTGDTVDVIKLAETLLEDKDTFIHKAVGWMLRVVGDIDRKALLTFLDKHAAAMPTVMLSYATEKLDKSVKEHYRAKRKVNLSDSLKYFA